MTTTPKLIVAPALLAAVVAGALAAPAAAQVRREPWIPVSTNNVFWGLALGPPILDPVFPQPSGDPVWGHAYGAAGPVPPGAPVPGRAYVPRILDCVHIAFPQCGAN